MCVNRQKYFENKIWEEFGKFFQRNTNSEFGLATDFFFNILLKLLK